MKQFQYVNRLGARNKLYRLAWSITNSLLFRPTPRWVLDGWRCALLRAFGAKIGVGCRIDPTSHIWMPSNLKLGDYVAIGAGADIYCVAPITMGSKVTISQRAFICAASHDINELNRPLIYSPITIGDHVWIAAEAMVLPGAQIGDGAVVGARAVLSKNANAWSIYTGNPARHTGDRNVASSATQFTNGGNFLEK